jgi:hypothetical protein
MFKMNGTQTNRFGNNYGLSSIRIHQAHSPYLHAFKTFLEFLYSFVFVL